MQKWGYHYFPLEIFGVAVPEYFIGESFCVSEKFWHRKIVSNKRGYHVFLSKFFGLKVPKNYVREPFCASLKVRYRKVSYLKRGLSRYSVERFLSHSAEKFRRGTLLWFRKILVSKNVGDKRVGGYHNFPSKLFCLTVPKHFVEEPFCVSESFGYPKIL